MRILRSKDLQPGDLYAYRGSVYVVTAVNPEARTFSYVDRWSRTLTKGLDVASLVDAETPRIFAAVGERIPFVVEFRWGSGFRSERTQAHSRAKARNNILFRVGNTLLNIDKAYHARLVNEAKRAIADAAGVSEYDPSLLTVKV